MAKMPAVSGLRARWAVPAAVLALLAASAAGADETGAVRPAAAAWYPSGVGTVIAATYPEGTLHVGAAAGQETDRTYLRFELPAVPDDAYLQAIAIAIPVRADAGTSAPEAAVLLGCAVPGGFDPDASTPPAVDCDGAPEATFLAGDAPAFSLSLPAPSRATHVDVALVPGGGDTWHVGFDGPDGDGAPTMVATYDEPAPRATTTVANRDVPPPTQSPPDRPVALPPPPLTPPPVASGAAVADESTQAAPTPAAAPLPVSTTPGFRYTAIFLLPLALLVVVGLLGDGLTRPIRLREDAT